MANLDGIKTERDARRAGVLDEWLEARDEQVKAKLLRVLETAADERAEALRLADEKAQEICKIRKAVADGHWWELRSYLTGFEIESLCGISPVDLLDD